MTTANTIQTSGGLPTGTTPANGDVPTLNLYSASAGTDSLKGLLQAGQNAIGNVGGKTVEVGSGTLTLAGTTYGTNFSVGGLITLTNAFTSTKTGLLISARASIGGATPLGSLSLALFNAAPAGTVTDNGALSLASADYTDKFLGMIALQANQQGGATNGSIYFADGLAKLLVSTDTSMRAILVANAAFGSTIAAATIKFYLTIQQDC